MARKVKILITFVIVFVVLPSIAGFWVSKISENLTYGFVAGVCAWFILSIIWLIIEVQRSKNTDYCEEY